jgi:hypothetical protein
VGLFRFYTHGDSTIRIIAASSAEERLILSAGGSL